MKLFSAGQEAKKKRLSIFIPVDILVLSGVVLSLLLALTYSLGIEKGRHSAMAPIMLAKRTVVADKPAGLPQANLPGPQTSSQSDSEIVVASAKPAQRPLEYASLPNRYTIQVASYKGQGPAMREAQKLQRNGQTANISQKGDYWVIYVGDYDAKTEAAKNAARLKDKYGECFVRRL